MSLLRRFIALFRRSRFEDEMAEEMRLHLELQAERNREAGMSESGSRAAARRQFGGMAQIQERARDVSRVRWIENVIRDAGFAARTLRKNPGFTAVVVLTLALGIGVNTALFTWFNAAAFRPLPVPQARQLYALQRMGEKGVETKSMSYTDFVHYREHQTVFSGLAASAGWRAELLDVAEFDTNTREQPALARVELVSTNYFAVFGVPMALGRTLMPEDENPSNAAPVIVLSHRFWQNHFGGDPVIIGKTIRLRGLTAEALTVVGVAGQEYHGTRPGAPIGWVPMMLRPGETWRSNLKNTNYVLTGRLRPGISPEQATEELQVIANEFLVRPNAGSSQAGTISLVGASTYINLTRKQLASLLPVFLVFGAVLLISCANAANLILARMVTRQFELAIRGAFGATRQRLFALVMTESFLLGILGGLVGWGVAAGLLHGALPRLLDMIPEAREGTAGLYLHADYRVLTFTLLVSVLAGAAGGLMPALRVTRHDVMSALKHEGSAFGNRLRISRVRNFLAIAQLTLCSALLFITGLLIHRPLSAHFADAGFDKSRVVTLEIRTPRTYDRDQLDSARRQVLERIRKLPDVAAVSEMPLFPFGLRYARASVRSDKEANNRTMDIVHRSIPANYFEVLQLPLVRGRPFSTNEIASDRIAIISESAARQFWPDTDALGQCFEVPASVFPGGPESATAITDEAELPTTSLTVVGIARDSTIINPWSGDRPVVYLPLALQQSAPPFLLIRTNRPADTTLATLRQAGSEVTKIAPRVQTLDELSEAMNVQHRLVAWMAGIVSLISLIVAVIGLHGVISFSVNQRIREIGIRMALGATSHRVVSDILGESLRLVGLGTLVGFGLSIALAHFAQTFLLRVESLDPLTSTAVVVLLATFGVVACWVPAKRASKVDPAVALRAD